MAERGSVYYRRLPPDAKKRPLLGWRPQSAEDEAWVRALAVQRGVTVASLLDEALNAYRASLEAPDSPEAVKRRADTLSRSLREADDEQLRTALIVIGSNQRNRLLTVLDRTA